MVKAEGFNQSDFLFLFEDDIDLAYKSAMQQINMQSYSAALNACYFFNANKAENTADKSLEDFLPYKQVWLESMGRETLNIATNTKRFIARNYQTLPPILKVVLAEYLEDFKTLI